MTNWLSGDRLRGAWLAMLLAVAPWSNAEVVPDLYSVSVPVAEQSQSELQRAAAAGLRELAVRIAGRTGAASEPALASSFANAMQYLEQYRYERSTGGESPWLAQLRFAPALVDGQLRKAGLPVWGGNRPALISVIAVDDKGARTLVDEQSPLANALREQWRRRGLLLHLPRNTAVLNIDDVMRLDSASVSSTLSERGDGLVLGRLTTAANGNCEMRLVLNLGGQTFAADSAGANASMCVASAIDRIADSFSAQYAIKANGASEGVILRVTGVVSFDDYSALLSYLRRLAIIKSAQPVLVNGEEIQLQLKLAGDIDQFTRQLALENRLASSPESANASPVAALNYRWMAARR